MLLVQIRTSGQEHLRDVVLVAARRNTKRQTESQLVPISAIIVCFRFAIHVRLELN
jgi:hypothetical protein